MRTFPVMCSYTGIIDSTCKSAREMLKYHLLRFISDHSCKSKVDYEHLVVIFKQTGIFYIRYFLQFQMSRLCALSPYQYVLRLQISVYYPYFVQLTEYLDDPSHQIKPLLFGDYLQLFVLTKTNAAVFHKYQIDCSYFTLYLIWVYIAYQALQIVDNQVFVQF